MDSKVDTDVSEKHTLSIFRAESEDGESEKMELVKI
jgi:hypothetical protein